MMAALTEFQQDGTCAEWRAEAQPNSLWRLLRPMVEADPAAAQGSGQS
jgi:hypothetical protein